MVKTDEVEKAYQVAKERYAEIGVDTEKAMEALRRLSYRSIAGKVMTFMVS
ncbi:L-rhamnose isomerase [Lactiplantibacillus plantarum subsp. plantarum]|uniref:L-rhamnose isomerase n=1 Tax=Lactiplantibacillus plantarum subsp. plantarum TaxID=337330 RepID=A0A2S3UAI6_LACPN|nr:L-rhamnose isomerase [Lactiplantibacillus plantarum subsp. plantarum]